MADVLKETAVVDEKYRDILAQRAKKAAKAKAALSDGEIVEKIVVVAVGNEKFGIPLDQLSFVIKTPIVTPLPDTPSWSKGLVYSRGNLVSATCLGTWFNIENVSGDFLAVVEGKKGKMGFLVDRVLQFVDLEQSELSSAFQESVAAIDRPIKGTTKGLVSILDLDRLLELLDSSGK